MGKKYIIELLDDCQSEFKGIMVFGVTQEKQISVELIPEESLRPYTEPDLEQVKCEAYEEGRNSLLIEVQKAGKNKIKLEEDEYYQRGLYDAWEAARKIWENDMDTLQEIFGWVPMRMDVFLKYTASECIEKIRQYEQKELKVGDEVITDSGKAVVMGVGPVHFEYFNADGSSGYDEVKNVKKTGRTFPEIASVFDRMREES